MQIQVSDNLSENSGTAAAIFSPDALDKLVRFAEIMANSRVTVPAHLAGKAADCLAVTMQAIQWRMNPFAVAQKTFLINGVLGYEAQLVNAVITTMAPTKDRPHYEWFGPWEKVIGKFVEKTSPKGNKYIAPGWTLADEAGCGVRIWATMKNEQEPRQLELLLSQAQVRNSTLWASDPKQQLAYLAVKRWARLHCPDVILGVYTPDEIELTPPAEKDISPAAGSDLNTFISQTSANKKAGNAELPPEQCQADTAPSESDTLSPLTPQNAQQQSSEPTEINTGPVTQGKNKVKSGGNSQQRTSDKLLEDFCEAAMNSKSVSELAKCFAYASKVLAHTQPLLDKATDAFLMRKAELDEEAGSSKA